MVEGVEGVDRSLVDPLASYSIWTFAEAIRPSEMIATIIMWTLLVRIDYCDIRKASILGNLNSCLCRKLKPVWGRKQIL
jgi:hypothetical protein